MELRASPQKYIHQYKIHIVATGCDRRLLDANKLKNYFLLNNCEVINNPKEADVIIVSTCGFSESQENTSLNVVKKMKVNGERKGAKMIVVGCVPALAPEKLKAIHQGHTFHVSNLEMIDEVFPEFETKYKSLPDVHELYSDLNIWDKFKAKFQLSQDFLYLCVVALKFKMKNTQTPLHRGIREGVYLRTSGGCFDKCTYCAIPQSIGGLKSKPLDACVSEYKEMLDKGERRFIFTADNLGSYGLDSGSNFEKLLQALSQVDESYEGVQWILGELHPVWVNRYHSEIFKHVESMKIVEIMCPIQSGSSRMLALMQRDTQIIKTVEHLKSFKRVNSQLKLNTDVIIGFPGEQDEDLNQTLNILNNIQFDQVQLFKYSDRRKTKASELTNKIPDFEILRRVRKAIAYLNRNNIPFLYQ